MIGIDLFKLIQFFPHRTGCQNADRIGPRKYTAVIVRAGPGQFRRHCAVRVIECQRIAFVGCNITSDHNLHLLQILCIGLADPGKNGKIRRWIKAHQLHFGRAAACSK